MALFSWYVMLKLINFKNCLAINNKLSYDFRKKKQFQDGK